MVSMCNQRRYNFKKLRVRFSGIGAGFYFWTLTRWALNPFFRLSCYNQGCCNRAMDRDMDPELLAADYSAPSNGGEREIPNESD